MAFLPVLAWRLLPWQFPLAPYIAWKDPGFTGCFPIDPTLSSHETGPLLSPAQLNELQWDSAGTAGGLCHGLGLWSCCIPAQKEGKEINDSSVCLFVLPKEGSL